MKLDDAITQFLVERAQRGLVSGSLRTYTKALRSLTVYAHMAGYSELSDFTTPRLQKFIEHERQRPKQRQAGRPGRQSATTIMKGVKIIHTFFMWAASAHMIADDPTARLFMPREGKRLPKALKPEQVAKVLPQPMSARDRAVIYFMLDTGTRLSETVNIDLNDVDLTAGTALIRHGKGDRDRMVVFSALTADALRAWLALRFAMPDCAALFVSTHLSSHRGIGTRLSDNALYGAIKRLARAAGLDGLMRPHVLRHTFATMYLDNGGAVQDLCSILGHSDIHTTMLYVGITSKNLHRKHMRYSPILRMLEDLPAARGDTAS